jgi:hypothetical protein
MILTQVSSLSPLIWTLRMVRSGAEELVVVVLGDIDAS